MNGGKRLSSLNQFSSAGRFMRRLGRCRGGRVSLGQVQAASYLNRVREKGLYWTSSSCDESSSGSDTGLLKDILFDAPDSEDASDGQEEDENGATFSFDWLDEQLLCFEDENDAEAMDVVVVGDGGQLDRVSNKHANEGLEMETQLNHVKMVDLTDDVTLLLLGLDASDMICISGANMILELLYGQMSVNGYELIINKPINVSLGLSNHKLYVKLADMVPDMNDFDIDQLSRMICNLNLDDSIIEQLAEELKTFTKGFCILKVSKFDSLPLGWLDSMVNSSECYSLPRPWFRVSFIDNLNPVPLSWQIRIEIELLGAERIRQDSIILVSGTANSGKSSLIRYTINRLLSLTENASVIHFDCDPGQTEFTPSGQISAAVINEPLLSPTFANVACFDTELFAASSVGGVNPGQDPDLYLTALDCVWNQVEKEHRQRKCPVFINTMGWLQGIGLNLIVDLIKLVRPTIVIQLDVINTSPSPKKKDASGKVDSPKDGSLKDDANRLELNAGFVRKSPGWSQRVRSVQTGLNYHHFLLLQERLTTLGGNHTGKGPNARKMCTMAYFSRIEQLLYRPLHQVAPVRLSLDSVLIHIVARTPSPASHALDCIKWSFVQLVNVCDEEEAKGHDLNYRLLRVLDDNVLVGCGIVVDVNLQSREMLIVTPLSAALVQHKVNCVVMPSRVEVPKELLLERVDYCHDLSDLPDYVGIL